MSYRLLKNNFPRHKVHNDATSTSTVWYSIITYVENVSQNDNTLLENQMKNVITKENKDFNDRFCVVDTFRTDNNVFNVMMGTLKNRSNFFVSDHKLFNSSETRQGEFVLLVGNVLFVFGHHQSFHSFHAFYLWVNGTTGAYRNEHFNKLRKAFTLLCINSRWKFGQMFCTVFLFT